MASAPPLEGRAEGRVPPHDLDAENSVLGAILLDPSAITRVLENLRPEDFYRENNAQIYKAGVSLFQAGEPIDNVTLAAALERQGVLERVGGRAQLALLAESVPTAANVEYYARIVKSKAIKRKLIRAGAEVASVGFDESVEADDALNRAEKAVFDVAEERVSSAMSRLYELLRPAMDRIDAQMSSGNAVIGVPSGFYDLDNLTSGFKASDLIVVAGRPAMGKCLTAGTLIDDPQSGARLTIEQFVRRRLPMVWGVSEDGSVRPTEVGGWVDSGVQETYRICTRTGRQVEVTGHHPFLTVHGWQPLHDLRLGDKIAVPRQLPGFGSDDSLALDQVRLLAYYLAEGGLTGISPAFSNTDPEILEDHRLILAKRYPELRLRFDGRCTDTATQGRNSLRGWLERMGLCGSHAADRRFPSCAWLWDRPRLREFLRVLMSCDGTIYSMGGYLRIEFAVASDRLAEDVQHALTRFGVVSRLWKEQERCWRVEITEPQSIATYQREIGWIGEKARRFGSIAPMPEDSPLRMSNVGQLSSTVWPALRAAAAARGLQMSALAVAAGEWQAGVRGYNPHSRRELTQARMAASADVLGAADLRRLINPDLYWDELASIEPSGRQQVYDLTVPDGANFIAQDVVVHNTSFMLNLTLHAAVERQVPVAVFSLEMSKEQLVERLLCQQARIDSQRMHRGMLSEAEYERLVMAIGPLENAPIFIDDSPMLDELALLLKARQARLRENVGMIVLDYLQLMQGRSRGDDFNRVQEVSSISRSLKGLARELHVPVIAISQLSRAPEARPNKRPMLSDLRESGCLAAATPVFLPDLGAYRSIGELADRSGFRVLALNPATWRLEPRSVSRAFRTGVKPVFRLATRSGRALRATANHRFLTMAGWKRLDELSLTDRIAMPHSLSPLAAGLQQPLLTRDPASGDAYWDQVAVVAPDGEADVFDLTVGELHNFSAAGLIVHNSIEQDSDIVIFLYRDEYYNPNTDQPGIAEVHIAKHRNGPTDTIKLRFRKDQTLFYNLESRRSEAEPV